MVTASGRQLDFGVLAISCVRLVMTAEPGMAILAAIQRHFYQEIVSHVETRG
jgi:hypothetical protein